MAGTSRRRATRRSSTGRVIRVWRMSLMNGLASMRCWKRRERTRWRRWPSSVPAPGKTERARTDLTGDGSNFLNFLNFLNFWGTRDGVLVADVAGGRLSDWPSRHHAVLLSTPKFCRLNAAIVARRSNTEHKEPG